MKEQKPFVLTQEDRNTALWKALFAHMENRLIYLRIQNDRAISIDETNKLRGQIEEVKNFIRLNRMPQEIE